MLGERPAHASVVQGAQDLVASFGGDGWAEDGVDLGGEEGAEWERELIGRRLGLSLGVGLGGRGFGSGGALGGLFWRGFAGGLRMLGGC